MRGAPIPPEQYDGEHLNTDEKLEAEGWAAGLDVWEQVGKGYSGWYLKDDTLGNAQLWSLREAIRAEYLAELTSAGRLTDTPALQAEARGWGPDFTEIRLTCPLDGCSWEYTYRDSVTIGELIERVVAHTHVIGGA